MQNTTQPPRRRSLLWTALGLAGGFCLTSNAQSHYPIGLEGLNGGSWPEPGFHLRDYNYFYYADRFNDESGNSVFDDFELFSYANGIRPIWVADFGILGAHYGCDVLIPLVYTDLKVEGFGDDAFGLGDILVEPASLSWRRNHWDAVLSYGFWAPTGDQDGDEVSVGLGHWTHMFSAGGVWYPTDQRDWSLSLLARYEINTEDEDEDITAGDTFSLEWGLGYAFSPQWNAGVAGYYQRQVTTTDGDGVLNVLPTVAGIGPEIGFRPGEGRFGFSLRYAYEFLAEERSPGHLAVLTISMKF